MSFWSFINISLIIRLITSVLVVVAESLAKSGYPNYQRLASIGAENCRHCGAFVRPPTVAMLSCAREHVGGPS